MLNSTPSGRLPVEVLAGRQVPVEERRAGIVVKAESGNDEDSTPGTPSVIYDSAGPLSLQLLVRFLFMILSRPT